MVLCILDTLDLWITAFCQRGLKPNLLVKYARTVGVPSLKQRFQLHY